MISGRLHAPHVTALAYTKGQTIELRAPMPGHFIPAIGAGDLITPDEVIGQLVLLGRSLLVRAGNTRGLAVSPGAPRAVAYNEVLVAIDLDAQVAGALPEQAAAAATPPAHRMFLAPTSGRFYGRPGPDKPAFVEAGSQLAAGTTICLLEVMKTFHRVTYSGDPARVRTVLVADGDDVNAGDALLALE
jgi:acetyl-CoA carboxylase biotin carboxyl carrier protein